MKKTIEDNKLEFASHFAIQEANRWFHISQKIIEKDLFRERNVMLAYCCELYLKGILMKNKINVTNIPKKKIGNGHNLYDLYILLPTEIKEKIIENVNFKSVEIKNFYTGEVEGVYKDIEELLGLVSNDFLELRYIYEKYANGQPVLVVDNVLDNLFQYLKKLSQDKKIESE